MYGLDRLGCERCAFEILFLVGPRVALRSLHNSSMNLPGLFRCTLIESVFVFSSWPTFLLIECTSERHVLAVCMILRSDATCLMTSDFLFCEAHDIVAYSGRSSRHFRASVKLLVLFKGGFHLS